MELRHLASFVETARAGTYARAGQRLHLAQPAVWKHVQILEAELGLALFERRGRGVQLTPAGRTLVTRAEQVLDGTGRLRELAQDLRIGRVGQITIGCLARHVIGFLGSALGTFHRLHPEVRVVIDELELESHTDVADVFGDALRSGTVDMVFGPQLSGARSIAAYESTVVCALAPRHPWRRAGSIDVVQLKDEPVLVAPRGYYSRRALERACRSEGFEPLVALESASPTVLVQLGEEGLGIPIVSGDALPRRRWPFPSLVHQGRTLGAPVWVSARENMDVVTSRLFEVVEELVASKDLPRGEHRSP